MLLFILFQFLVPHAQAEAIKSNDWVSYARRFSGESDFIRGEAIRSLSKMPSLEDDLRRALHESSLKQSLALDVIATLKLKPLWKDLVKYSSRDQSGMSYLSLIALTDETNHLAVKALFLQRLKDPASPAVSKMILLDALMRMNQPISVSMADSLLKDSSPEVRSAALYYIRGMTLRQKDHRYLPLIQGLKSDSHCSSQFQTQLSFFMRELEHT